MSALLCLLWCTWLFGCEQRLVACLIRCAVWVCCVNARWARRGLVCPQRCLCHTHIYLGAGHLRVPGVTLLSEWDGNMWGEAWAPEQAKTGSAVPCSAQLSLWILWGYLCHGNYASASSDTDSTSCLPARQPDDSAAPAGLPGPSNTHTHTHTLSITHSIYCYTMHRTNRYLSISQPTKQTYDGVMMVG